MGGGPQNMQPGNTGSSSGRAERVVGGFAEGGYTGQPTDAGETAAASGLFLAAAAEFRQATENLRMIRAFVTLQDIDDQRKILDSARRPFTRNNP